MRITSPDSTEWIKDGKPTPVFIQFVDQFKTWINDRQDVLDAEAAVVVEEEVEASKLLRQLRKRQKAVEDCRAFTRRAAVTQAVRRPCSAIPSVARDLFTCT